MLLVIDNYDSFTYNLVQYFGQLGVEQKVYRNDQITVEEALALNPDRVMISPGPCSPAEAGVSCDMIRAFAGKKPVLGVCLGHQAIGHVYGGNVIRAPHLMHGKTSPVFHNDTDVFKGLPSPFAATRYHSLVVERSTFPAALEVTADGVKATFGEQEQFFDKVLVAVGRVPNSSGLELESVGVLVENGAVKVDARMQTSTPNIYAIGDVTGGIQLAHVASYQAGVAVRSTAREPAMVRRRAR